MLTEFFDQLASWREISSILIIIRRHVIGTRFPLYAQNYERLQIPDGYQQASRTTLSINQRCSLRRNLN